MRRRIPLIAVAAVAMAATPAALGHVTVAPPSAPADGYAKLDFRVPHGCDGSPTTAVTVQIPAGINAATAQVVAGWTITKRMEPLDPPVDDGHGGQLTERVASVTWSGGPLAADQLEEFGLSLRLPATVGPLAFPTVQNCQRGVARWIELADEGGPEPDMPSPVLELTAADGVDTDAEGEASGGNGRANLALGLAVGGLLLGGAGLAAGVTATRRRPS